MASNAAMNRMFVAAARRGDRTGALARLGVSRPVDTDTPFAERLTRLLDEREAAMQAGDADALAFVEHKLERWDEARAAQKAAEQPPPASFDGGWRGRRTVAPPGGGGQQPTPGELLLASITASRVARRERDADSGQTIVANF